MKRWKRGSAILLAAALLFTQTAWGFEARAANSRSGRAAAKVSAAVYYLDGENGSDSNDGFQAERAFRSMEKLMEVLENVSAEEITVNLTGDITALQKLEIGTANAPEGRIIKFQNGKASGAKAPVIHLQNGIQISNVHAEFQGLKLSFEGNSGIHAVNGGLSVLKTTEVSGAPDIAASLQSAVILETGTYGKLENDSRDSGLEIMDVHITGIISGWERLDINPGSGETSLDGDIERVGLLFLWSNDRNFTVRGNIHAETIDTDGGYSHFLSIASGKSLEAEVLKKPFLLSVLPASYEVVQEGVYLSVGAQETGSVSLYDTFGYRLNNAVSADRKIKYTLTSSGTVQEPENLKWSDRYSGLLTWSPVEGASGYRVELFKDGKCLAVKTLTDTEFQGFSYVSVNGRGMYQCFVTALGSADVSGDSQRTGSEKIELPLVKVSKIAMNPSGICTVYKGQTVHFTASAFPENAYLKEIAFSSSSPAAATVDTAGNVTGIKAGSSVITASAVDGSGIKSQCTVKVVDEAAKIGKPQITRLLNTNGQISLSYTAVKSAEQYEIMYAADSSFRSAKIIKTDKTSAVIKGLSKGRPYYVKIRAGRRGFNNQQVYGSYGPASAGYSIKYVLNGGVNSSANPTAYYGNKVTLKNPSRSGYRFLGWYTSTSYKTKVTALSKGNYTLYAKWAKISVKKPSITCIQNPVSGKMKVSYSKLGGVSGYQIVYSTSKKYPKASTRTITTGSVSRTISGLKANTSYYVKVRGYAVDSKGSKIYGAYSSSLVGYSIKYYLNGGRNNSNNYIRYYNTSVTLKNPVRKGYVFKGWYTSKKYKTRIKSIKKGKRVNYRLYAKWTKRR